MLDLQEIEELGKYTPIDGFRRPGTKDIHFIKNPLLKKTVEKLVNPRPAVNAKKCIGCGQCAQNCPVEAIEMKEKLPQIDFSKCIKCFCCHELCPMKAMQLKRNKLWSAILRI